MVGDARTGACGAVDLFLFHRAQELRREVQLLHLPPDLGDLGAQRPVPTRQLPVALDAVLEVDPGGVCGEQLADLGSDQPLDGLELAGRLARGRGVSPPM